MTAPTHTPALAIATVFAVAAIALPASPAAAEPKNDVPFVTATFTGPAAGEPKNVTPFTRAARSTPADRALIARHLAVRRLPATGLATLVDRTSPDARDAAFLAHHPSRAAALDRNSPEAKETAQRAGLRDLKPWERWQATHASRGMHASATKDAVIVVHATPVSPIVVGGGNRFDWTDAGIGAAGGFGIALLLAGSFVLTRRGRQGERLVVPV